MYKNTITSQATQMSYSGDMAIETLLISLGISIGKSLVEGWLKTTIEDTTFETAATGTFGELTKHLQKSTVDIFTARAAKSQVEQIAAEIARNLEKIVKNDTKVDDGAKEAVIQAVGHSIHGVSAFDLFEGDLEPQRIAERFKQNNSGQLIGLGQAEIALYERLIFEASTILIKMASKLPGFDVVAFKTVIDHGTQLFDMLKQVLDEMHQSSRTLPNEDDTYRDFTRKYLLQIDAKLNQMDHMGLSTLSNAIKTCPLDVAYISVKCDIRQILKQRNLFAHNNPTDGTQIRT
jgi:hypothetical protein